MNYGAMSYGHPPQYLTSNNPYTQMMVAQPRQQPQGGGMRMPMMNPMAFMGGFGGGGSAAGGSAAGTAGGSAAGGSAAGGSGAASSLGSLGPVGAIMAGVVASKGLEYRHPNGVIGTLGQTFNAPSFNQIKKDPKVGVTTALGIPFINSLIMNDKAKKAQPEWESLFNL